MDGRAARKLAAAMPTPCAAGRRQRGKCAMMMFPGRYDSSRPFPQNAVQGDSTGRGEPSASGRWRQRLAATARGDRPAVLKCRRWRRLSRFARHCRRPQPAVVIRPPLRFRFAAAAATSAAVAGTRSFDGRILMMQKHRPSSFIRLSPRVAAVAVDTGKQRCRFQGAGVAR